MAIGKIGSFFPGFIALFHFFFGFAFIAKDFDHFFPVNDLFNVAIQRRQCGLLLHKVWAGDTGDNLRDLDDAENANDHKQRQPHTDGEHGEKDRDQREKRAHCCRKSLAHHLTQCVNVIGVQTHDVTILVPIKVTDWQSLHLGEHVIAHALHGALGHKCHDPAIGQGGTNTTAKQQTHAKNSVEQSAHVRIACANQRCNVVVNKGPQKER